MMTLPMMHLMMYDVDAFSTLERWVAKAEKMASIVLLSLTGR
jgi:hypothetical protein